MLTKTVVLILLLFISLVSHGQEENSAYYSQFETSDTAFTIELRAYEKYRRLRVQCYANRNATINVEDGSPKIRDSIQDFLISKIEPHAVPKVLERLRVGELKVFNEYPVPTRDSLVANDLYNFHCDDLRYEFVCYFMFDDSIWFPITLQIDREGELMFNSTILESLESLSTYELPSRSDIYRTVYGHRAFKKYPAESRFRLLYSEKRKLFYYEFIASNGEEIERKMNSLTRKMNHMYIDAFTGEILWTPTIVHKDGGGSCTIWTQIEIPKNRLFDI